MATKKQLELSVDGLIKTIADRDQQIAEIQRKLEAADHLNRSSMQEIDVLNSKLSEERNNKKSAEGTIYVLKEIIVEALQ